MLQQWEIIKNVSAQGDVGHPNGPGTLPWQVAGLDGLEENVNVTRIIE
jgi:hypothetical protein